MPELKRTLRDSNSSELSLDYIVATLDSKRTRLKKPILFLKGKSNSRRSDNLIYATDYIIAHLSDQYKEKPSDYAPIHAQTSHPVYRARLMLKSKKARRKTILLNPVEAYNWSREQVQVIFQGVNPEFMPTKLRIIIGQYPVGSDYYIFQIALTRPMIRIETKSVRHNNITNLFDLGFLYYTSKTKKIYTMRKMPTPLNY